MIISFILTIGTGTCLGLFVIGVLLLILSRVVTITTKKNFKQTSRAIFNVPILWLKSLDGISCMPVWIVTLRLKI